MWYEDNDILRIKKNHDVLDRVIIKLRNNDTTYSCIIPTVSYPLNGRPEIFTCQNTEEITDKMVLKIFDKVYYERHECYENTDRLVNKLRKAGYDAQSYFGWFFQGPDLPIHHAWCVLNNSVLDLSDHWTVIEDSPAYKEIFGNEVGIIKNNKELIAMGKIVDAFENQYSNTKRCTPIGIPTKRFVYIGSPCDKDTARIILKNRYLNN